MLWKPRSRPKAKVTVNRLGEQDVKRLMSGLHFCPRCHHEMVFIGLSNARGINSIVKACPKCGKRIGLSYLSGSEVRVF
jgi:ribosomal protein S27AE